MTAVELGPTKVTRPGLWGHGRIEGLPLSGDISSSFGWRLVTPALKRAGLTVHRVDADGTEWNFHAASDIPAPAGTPIGASAPCDVVFSGVDSVGTHIVTVRFDDGTGALHAHLRAGAPMAPKGARLRRGDFIGFVGTTGVSTGNHLHYGRLQSVLEGPAWYDRSVSFDPLTDPALREVIEAEVVDPTTPPAPSTPPALPGAPAIASLPLLFFWNSLAVLQRNPPADWNRTIEEMQDRIVVIDEALRAGG